MASKMTIIQHTCEGFLRFIIPEDTVTVDMEVMTLKGVYIFRQDKNTKEKAFIPRSEHNTLLLHSQKDLERPKVNHLQNS